MKAYMEQVSIYLDEAMRHIKIRQVFYPEDSEEYKNMDYMHSLLNVVWGSTELPGSTAEEREKDLKAVKEKINKIEVM